MDTRIQIEWPGYCYWADATHYEKIPTTKTSITTVLLSNLSEAKPYGWQPQWVMAKNRTYPTRPLYLDNPWKAVGRVKVGTDCENEKIKDSTGSTEWHYTTNIDGKRGLAVCEH